MAVSKKIQNLQILFVTHSETLTIFVAPAVILRPPVVDT